MAYQEHIVTAVISIVSAVLIARLSKTRGERLAELLDKVSQAYDTTVDQLVENLALIEGLKQRIGDLEKKNSFLWQYVYQLIAQLKRHKIKPVQPPDELLESDPKLLALVNGFARKRRAKK